MSDSLLEAELVQAEGMIFEGLKDDALGKLVMLTQDAEEYITSNCVTTDEVQYFSFPTMFEYLAYKKVENDPREIRDAGEPFDRLYADLALAQVMAGDYSLAGEALKQAVRWNPMECEHRLRLADICLTNGDVNEYLALSYSCFERASDVQHLIRAYVNFASYYNQTGQTELCCAALKCAVRLNFEEASLMHMLEEVSGTNSDPKNITDEQANELLAKEGIPEGANAEIAICLLMCASDAAQVKDKVLATNLTLKARDLIGAPACAALIELIQAEGGVDNE